MATTDRKLVRLGPQTGDRRLVLPSDNFPLARIGVVWELVFMLETPETGILAFLHNAPLLTDRMSPRKKSNAKAHNPSEILIPEKLYFRIGEVARLCRLPAYVLRFWETEFPQLKPVKSSTGQRMYRRRDVENVVRIKTLLYDEGYTIAGARQHLRDEGKGEKKQVALPFPIHSQAELKHIRQGLQEILTILTPRR